MKGPYPVEGDHKLEVPLFAVEQPLVLSSVSAVYNVVAKMSLAVPLFCLELVAW